MLFPLAIILNINIIIIDIYKVLKDFSWFCGSRKETN